MKKYVHAKNAETGGEVLIEWDAGTKDRPPELTIYEDGIESEYRGYAITEGIVGVDQFFWRGKKLGILLNVHEVLLERFPNAEHVVEYTKADEWLCKDEKRACKMPLSFMANWLKRSRGGKYAKGGVIY